MTAMSLLGTPYRYGGNTPQGGFDCSGLVAYVVSAATGVQLPRDSAGMASVSRPLDDDTPQEGDLVFFNTLSRPYSHVGIYIGQDRFINAPSSGGRVRLDKLSNRYFARRYEGARTLFAG